MLIRLSSAGYFRFQLLLFVLRVGQPLRIIVLPCIALLQLIAGLLERTLILTDRILLQLKVRCRVESFEDRPAVVVSKFSTPAEASRNADFASWICLLMDLILRVKLSLFSDSDTTRSRSVSLMPAHHLLLFLSIIWHLTNRKKTFILCINKKEEVLPCKCS